MSASIIPRILPVMDLMDGQVVRGVAGRRSEYRPIQSRWSTSALPLDIASALRERFGWREFYLADLDAITGRELQRTTLLSLLAAGFSLQLDAGVRSNAEVRDLLDSAAISCIIGLESVSSPGDCERLIAGVDRSRVIFSLDLKGALPLASREHWPTSPLGIARLAVEMGFERMIVLDLEAVGVGGGCQTQALCRSIRERWPRLQLTTGGGIREASDVSRLVEQGVDRVLVASAIHDGRISERHSAG